MASNDDQAPRRAGAVQVLKSVLAAALGVQSSRRFEQDTRARSAGPFILLGLAGTALFVLALIAVVRLVLRAAGA